ncbi:MAG TPA: phage holin family protein [Usitatibacter sp.]|nr:phage holin family protein [Usitatibacter sp.]
MDSWRPLAGSFAALVRTRLELALLELREDGERRKDTLVAAALGGAFLAMGTMAFTVFVVVLFWDTHRIAAAGGIAVIYLAIGLLALLRAGRLRAEAPPPFQATLAEFARDAEALRGAHD